MTEARRRDINILFLGETGVGKSTFINAFHNYLKYKNLKNAMKDKPIVLIPAKLKIMDENYQLQVVNIGDAKEKLKETGPSETKATKSYVLPISGRNVNLRLINTPPITDLSAINFDKENFENILDFIAELKHLNAICILLQPNCSNSIVNIEYCVRELLLKLGKDVCNNLIFVFTKSRRTGYGPGESLKFLEKVFNGIKEEQNVQIALHKNNVFGLDNESFRCLAAHDMGIKVSFGNMRNYVESWRQSAFECGRLIDYIAGTDDNLPLEPHLVINGTSINVARCLVVNLSQPLVEIAQLIQDNIALLEKHKNELQSIDQPITKLFNKLFVPVLDLKITKLDQPAMVCTSTKCSELYEVSGVKRWHYKQICHSPCYLGGVPKEIIGSPLLANCEAMGGQPLCQKCRCEYQKHMHIYYTTATFMTKLINVRPESPGKMDQRLVSENVKIIIKAIDDRLVEFKNERDIIIKRIAEFAHFLQINAIATYNDAYKHYLLYLIDREKLIEAYVDRKLLIAELEWMLNRYRQERRIIRNAPNGQSVGVNEILESVTTLQRLKHHGEKIKELFSSQISARTDEYEAKECFYSENASRPQQQLRSKSCKNTVRDSNKSNAKDNLELHLPSLPIDLETGTPTREFPNLEITKKFKIDAEGAKIDITFSDTPSECISTLPRQ